MFFKAFFCFAGVGVLVLHLGLCFSFVRAFFQIVKLLHVAFGCAHWMILEAFVEFGHGRVCFFLIDFFVVFFVRSGPRPREFYNDFH